MLPVTLLACAQLPGDTADTADTSDSGGCPPTEVPNNNRDDKCNGWADELGLGVLADARGHINH